MSHRERSLERLALRRVPDRVACLPWALPPLLTGHGPPCSGWGHHAAVPAQEHPHPPIPWMEWLSAGVDPAGGAGIWRPHRRCWHFLDRKLSGVWSPRGRSPRRCPRPPVWAFPARSSGPERRPGGGRVESEWGVWAPPGAFGPESDRAWLPFGKDTRPQPSPGPRRGRTRPSSCIRPSSWHLREAQPPRPSGGPRLGGASGGLSPGPADTRLFR